MANTTRRTEFFVSRLFDSVLVDIAILHVRPAIIVPARLPRSRDPLP